MLRGPLTKLLVFSLISLSTVARAEGPAALRLGLTSVYGDEAAQSNAKLLEGYLSQALKRPVSTRILDKYDQLAAAVAKGEVDVAWITPFAYVQAGKVGQVVPLAKATRRGMFYRSCLYVRASEKVSKISELKGKRAAWVEPESTSGYLLPRGLVLKEGQKPNGFFVETFAGDHKAACSAVLEGRADVGGTYTDADGEALPIGCRDALGAEAAAKLRCLAASQPLPNEVIAGRPGLDENTAGEVTRIFAGLSETDAGKRVLETVFRADGFSLALEEDFDGVRLVSRSLEAGRWLDAAAAKRRDDVLLNDLRGEHAAAAAFKQQKEREAKAAAKKAAKKK